MTTFSIYATTPDGVSINEHKKQKAIIPYSEFLNLKDLEAYVKLPEDYPVTRIKFDYKDIKSKNLAFISTPMGEDKEELEVNELENEENEDEQHHCEESPKFDLLKIRQ